MTNSDGLRQVPARAVTSARKATSKKMSQSFLTGREGRVFEYDPATKLQNQERPNKTLATSKKEQIKNQVHVHLFV